MYYNLLTGCRGRVNGADLLTEALLLFSGGLASLAFLQLLQQNCHAGSLAPLCVLQRCHYLLHDLITTRHALQYLL